MQTGRSISGNRKTGSGIVETQQVTEQRLNKEAGLEVQEEGGAETQVRGGNTRKQGRDSAEGKG